MEGIDWEKVIQELREEAEGASEEEKERGTQIASRFCYRRLSDRQKKEIRNANYKDVLSPIA